MWDWMLKRWRQDRTDFALVSCTDSVSIKIGGYSVLVVFFVSCVSIHAFCLRFLFPSVVHSSFFWSAWIANVLFYDLLLM